MLSEQIVDAAPRLTVGLPAYNAEDTIGRALESLLGQTAEHLAIVVSDNASTDRTAEIVCSFMDRDARISLAGNERNLGAPANFQLLIDGCGTEYFAFCGADDFWEPTFAERCLAALDVHPSVGSAFSYFRTFHHLDGTMGELVMPQAASFQSPFKRLAAYFMSCSSNAFYGIHRATLIKKAMDSISCGDFEDIALLQQLAIDSAMVVVPEDLFRSGVKGKERSIIAADGKMVRVQPYWRTMSGIVNARFDGVRWLILQALLAMLVMRYARNNR